MSRPTRARRPRGESVVGRRFEAVVGGFAHGGHCVVRLPEPEARVVFTRHTLPGERVVLEITEGTTRDRFWRADAVEVLVAGPDRVPAPCPVSGPGGCGGCDFQHVALEAQREAKTQVLREQLRRIAGIESDVVVEPMPYGDEEGLRWRTRVRRVRDAQGRTGFRAHRSHRVVEVDDCLVAAPDARELGSGADDETITQQVAADGRAHAFALDHDGFWQAHPAAASTFVQTALDWLQVRPGERALDLYAGVGVFAAFLADRVGPTGSVLAIESGRRAAEHARDNLPAWVRVECGRVDDVLALPDVPDAVDVVVLDPPREGAKAAVVDQVVALGPRAVVYVACDPASFARDAALFAAHGYEPTAVRAFDAFPMTHHLETLGLFVPAGRGSGSVSASA